MAYCRNCGTEIGGTDRFCRSCGADQQQGQPRVDPDDEARTGRDERSGSEPPATTHPMAAGALAAALVWFGGVGSILAIVFGNRARREIAAERRRYGGEGLATVAVVLGWIGMGGTVVAAIVFLNLVTTFDPRGEGVHGPAIEEEGFRLNLESALEEAGAAQRRYRAENGSFATDLETLDAPLYEGVRLELAWAEPDAFCIEGTHVDIPDIMHVSDGRAIARRGVCPPAD